jgi:hypothetical protein
MNLPQAKMSKAAPDYFDSHQSSVHLGSEEDTTIECDRKGREMKIDIIGAGMVGNGGDFLPRSRKIRKSRSRSLCFLGESRKDLTCFVAL